MSFEDAIPHVYYIYVLYYYKIQHLNDMRGSQRCAHGVDVMSRVLPPFDCRFSSVLLEADG